MRNSWLLFLLLGLLLLPLSAEPSDPRAQSLAILKNQGFRVSTSLPQGRPAKLRPRAEIQARLTAMQAVTLWVAAPPDLITDKDLKAFAKEQGIADWLTAEEKAIFALPRSQARNQYLNDIGWTMENMWSLAWVLGFDTQPALSGQLQGDLARRLVLKYLPSPNHKANWQPRAQAEVVALEDLFYCAHNAVRSAQAGADTVPSGFDPVEEGGCIHERRHGLTWCLSPGVSWEDTDLST